MSTGIFFFIISKLQMFNYIAKSFEKHSKSKIKYYVSRLYITLCFTSIGIASMNFLYEQISQWPRDRLTL